MPLEELFVDAHDNTLLEWLRTGAAPYLNDSSLNYIDTDAINNREGYFDFEDSMGSGTINSVKLRLESRYTFTDFIGGFEVRVYIYDGSDWHDIGTFWAPSSYDWIEIDISAIIDSWAKIDGCRMYVKSVTEVGQSVVFIRRGKLVVDYAPVVAKRVVGDGLTCVVT